MKKVGIWIRVSTEDQARGESPETHLARARTYLELKDDWQEVTIYDLAGVSGKGVLDHPSAKRMIADVKSGRIDVLIFSKIARIARNTRELLEVADLFQDCGADLVSIEENFDTGSPAGRFFYTMLSAMAQWEREEIVARINSSIKTRSKLGKNLGGKAPYGYAWVDGSLELDPVEAPIRRELFTLFLEHKRLKTVARVVNDKGLRTRRGAKWSDTTVRRLLTDPMAKGYRRSNYTQSTGEGKHWEFKKEEDWDIHECPACVSEEQWDSVQEIFRLQRDSRKPITKRNVHLFSGKLFCPCGTKMLHRTQTKKYTCGKCRRKIEAQVLEDLYHEAIYEYVMSEDEAREALKRERWRITELEEQLGSQRKILADSEKAIDHLIDLSTDGMITKDRFQLKYDPLEESINSLRQTISQMNTEIAYMKSTDLTIEAILDDAQSIYARFKDMSQKEKCELVDATLERVEIIEDDGEDEIEFVLIGLTHEHAQSRGNGGSEGSGGGGGDFPQFLPKVNYVSMATHPCPCGFFNHPTRECSCGGVAVQRYLGKVSGPLLDRIDLHVEVTPVTYDELSEKRRGEPSSEVRARVIAARALQGERFSAESRIHCNAHMTSSILKQICQLDPESEKLLRGAMEKLDLSARAYDRILKVARTIADLEASVEITAQHLAEAIQYRSLDRGSWG